MSLRYDLHSHSIASDGTLSPVELVDAAHTAGVDVLALTDHDTLDGLDAAARRASSLGLQLVSGVEISVSWGAQTIHVLGLGVDAQCPALQQGLARLREFRAWRAEEIGRRLARAGIGGCYDGARTLAKGNIVGRTHDVGIVLENHRHRKRRRHADGRHADLVDVCRVGPVGKGIEGQGHRATDSYLGGVDFIQISSFHAQAGGVAEHENGDAR